MPRSSWGATWKYLRDPIGPMAHLQADRGASAPLTSPSHPRMTCTHARRGDRFLPRRGKWPGGPEGVTRHARRVFSPPTAPLPASPDSPLRGEKRIGCHLRTLAEGSARHRLHERGRRGHPSRGTARRESARSRRTRRRRLSPAHRSRAGRRWRLRAGCAKGSRGLPTSLERGCP